LRTLAAGAVPGDGSRLSILIYHRVLPGPDPLNNWDPTAAEFESQIRALSRFFTPLALGEAVERLRKGTLPAHAACVTFDDGYRDNVDVALPILRRHGVPATFFIATGYLNGGRMWNDTVIESIRSPRQAPVPVWRCAAATCAQPSRSSAVPRRRTAY